MRVHDRAGAAQVPAIDIVFAPEAMLDFKGIARLERKLPTFNRMFLVIGVQELGPSVFYLVKISSRKCHPLLVEVVDFAGCGGGEYFLRHGFRH